MALNLPAGDAWAKTQDPDDPTNWVVLSYAEGSKTDLTVASGTGGLAEFCTALKDDAIHYGGFVVYGVDGRGNITSRREKFVQITWIGANVGVMAKSKVAGQRSKAMAYFSGYHIAYQIMDGDRDDISEAELEKKLLQVGGAHTPEYYDFGGGGAHGAAAGADAHEKEAGGGVDAAEAAEAAPAAKVAVKKGVSPTLVNEDSEQKVGAAMEGDQQVRVSLVASDPGAAAAESPAELEARNAALARQLAEATVEIQAPRAQHNSTSKEVAAILLQSVWRGYKERCRFDEMITAMEEELMDAGLTEEDAKEEAAQTMAALHMQRNFRGFQVRRCETKGDKRRRGRVGR